MRWARFGHPRTRINVSSKLDLRILVLMPWVRYGYPPLKYQHTNM